MKKIFYFLMLAVFILACGKENKNQQQAPANPIPASINGIWQVNLEAGVKPQVEVSELSAIEKTAAPRTSPEPKVVSFEKYENGKLSFASSRNYNWQEVGTFTLNGNDLKRTVNGLTQECVVTKLTETELNYNCKVIVGSIRGVPVFRNLKNISKRLSVADFDKIKAAPVELPAPPVLPAPPIEPAAPADAPTTEPVDAAPKAAPAVKPTAPTAPAVKPEAPAAPAVKPTAPAAPKTEEKKPVDPKSIPTIFPF